MVILTKMICPDGVELCSRHRHDFLEHTTKDGGYYMLDGGRDYTRWSGDGREKWVRITTDDDFELIRDNYARYNKYSQSYVKLKDISDPWLQNILDYFIDNNMTGVFFRLYLEEKLYRAEREIYVPEDENYELNYAT